MEHSYFENLAVTEVVKKSSISYGILKAHYHAYKNPPLDPVLSQ
jgi:hypothetical protein